MGIEAVVVVYFITSKGDDIPSSEVAHAAGHVAEATHPGGNLARADGNAASTVGGDGGEDVGRVVELAYLALVGVAEVGLDELLHHVGLLEMGIVLVESSHLVGIEPVLEVLAVEAVGLRIEPLVGDGMGVGRVDIGDVEGQPTTVAGEVGEETAVVARGAERGYMGTALIVGGIGGTLIDGLGRNNSLQLVELARGEAINLLQRHEALLGEQEEVVAVHTMSKVAHGEVALQLGRHEATHEGTLVDTLRTDVGEDDVVDHTWVEPRSYHSHEPLLEPTAVELALATCHMHHRGYLGDVVGISVGMGWQRFEVAEEGIVTDGVVALKHIAQVALGDALAYTLGGAAVEDALHARGLLAPAKGGGVVNLILAGDGIVARLQVAVDKVLADVAHIAQLRLPPRRTAGLDSGVLVDLAVAGAHDGLHIGGVVVGKVADRPLTALFLRHAVAIHLVADAADILVVGTLLIADALRLDGGENLVDELRGKWTVTLPFSLFTLPFLGSSYRALGCLSLGLVLGGKGSDVHGLGIGAVVYVGVVGKGRETRGVAALEVGSAAREAVVILVDDVEGELVRRRPTPSLPVREGGRLRDV